LRQTIVFVAIALTLICLIGFSSLEVPSQDPNGGSISETLSKAANYLATEYNPAVGLVRETPGSPNYWLYSDNFLAALALSRYGQENATLSTIATNISTTVNRYSGFLGGAVNQYMTLTSAPCQYPTAQDYRVSTSADIQIRVTLNDGSGSLPEQEYADIAFLKAVCLYRQGDTSQALQVYSLGRNMFDGIGFRDLPYNQTAEYQTYKLALFIYAAKVLNQPVSSAALSTLLMMQAPGGGFYTGYGADRSYGGTQTNAETTSLAILALSAIQK